MKIPQQDSLLQSNRSMVPKKLQLHQLEMQKVHKFSQRSQKLCPDGGNISYVSELLNRPTTATEEALATIEQHPTQEDIANPPTLE